MKRLFGFLLVLALAVISCSAQENSLIGTWRFTPEDGPSKVVLK